MNTLLYSEQGLTQSEIKSSMSLLDESVNLKTEKPSTNAFISHSRVVTVVPISEASIYFSTHYGELLNRNRISREGLTESVTQPSRNSFLKQKLEELNKMYSALKFKKEAILQIGIDVIQDCLKQRKLDIKISRTGEGELLIYREIDGAFNNLIIDEDADIEFMHIAVNRADSFNEYYPFIETIDTFALVSKL